MAYNPYEFESAQPYSPQQALAVLGGGLGPFAGGQPGPRRGSGGEEDAEPEPKPKPKSDDSSDTPPYPPEGAALSAEVFGALAERRRLADEALQKAIATEEYQTNRLKLAAEVAKQQTVRQFRVTSEQIQMKLGGRGLATDPRFSGRARRDLEMQKSERFGQISQTLADEISSLQEMVQAAETARDRELAKIAQEEALYRTNPSALIPAAAAYTG